MRFTILSLIIYVWYFAGSASEVSLVFTGHSVSGTFRLSRIRTTPWLRHSQH
jgi:hypothetical protein